LEVFGLKENQIGALWNIANPEGDETIHLNEIEEMYDTIYKQRNKDRKLEGYEVIEVLKFINSEAYKDTDTYKINFSQIIDSIFPNNYY